MQRHDTAGKGPGLVLRAVNGAMHLSLSLTHGRGYLEILETGGANASVGLKASHLKELAKALLKVAAALEMNDSREEITQH